MKCIIYCRVSTKEQAEYLNQFYEENSVDKFNALGTKSLWKNTQKNL